jgi:hypothetical protein
LEETTVANVLRGVHTKEKTGLVLLLGKALKSTNLNDIPTFSEDDIALLAPHLTSALARATPNQRVGFRLSYTPDIPPSARKAGQNSETTAGHLFADGLSLHLTLTQYRYMPGRTAPNHGVDKGPREYPDPDGLGYRAVTFLPETAVRPESENQSGFFSGLLADDPGDRTVVIDYQLLAKLLAAPPVAPPSPPVAAPVGQSLQPASMMSEQARKEDAELQAFKEELKALQKRLDEQKAELQELKKSSKKKKPAPLPVQ